MSKVWDITQPTDAWGRNYAKMEYQRIVDHDLWQPTTYIEVECKHDRKKYSGDDDRQYVECLDCDWYEEL